MPVDIAVPLMLLYSSVAPIPDHHRKADVSRLEVGPYDPSRGVKRFPALAHAGLSHTLTCKRDIFPRYTS